MLAGLAAAPLAGCAEALIPASAIPPAADSLDSLAGRSGRRFGSAIASTPGRARASIQNPAYTAIVAGECGVIVPENELKWQATRPGPRRFDFARMDAIVAWAQANALAVRGHALLWNRPRWFPGWLNNHDFGATPVREAERVLVEHIRTVTERYRGVITSYDVVNEAIDHDTNGVMQTSLSRALGGAEAVLDLAFHTAREQLPHGELVYNDYMSWEPEHAAHCADVLRLLEGFRRRGVPVDTLGIQSHLSIASIDPASGLGPYREREWRRFLDEVVAMGFKVMITEFDVRDAALPEAIPQRDAKVADYARRYLEVMLEYPALTDVLAWGMVDRFSWLQDLDARADGAEVRGCPYDSAYRPKPLRTALAQSFAAAAQP